MPLIVEHDCFHTRVHFSLACLTLCHDNKSFNVAEWNFQQIFFFFISLKCMQQKCLIIARHLWNFALFSSQRSIKNEIAFLKCPSVIFHLNHFSLFALQNKIANKIHNGMDLNKSSKILCTGPRSLCANSL